MESVTVSELTIEELKSLIREVVEQTISKMMVDPDIGLDLQDNVKEYLQTSMKSFQSGELETLPAKQVAEKLDIEW
jgi:hypothetical protein